MRYLKLLAHIFSTAILLAVFLLSSLAPTVQAALTYTAEEVVRSHGTIKLKPGAEITFEIHFKNTGSATWKNSGPNFVALATIDPEKRDSAIRHPLWPSEVNYRPAYLKQASVAPGETGIFRFPIKAPDAEGEYTESFQAVSKNLAWIEGTKFSIPVIVTQNPEGVKAEPVKETVFSNPSFSLPNDYPVRDDRYAGEWVGGQQLIINAEPGQQILQTVKVKNTGSITWMNTGSRFTSLYTVRPNYHESSFYTNGPGWMAKDQIRMASEKVEPGQIAEFKVLLSAPYSTGTHYDNFRLAVENYSWMAGGEIQIELNVASKENPNKQFFSLSDFKPVEEQTTEVVDSKSQEYRAQFLISSASSLTMNAGQTVSFKIGFKNIGEKTWTSSGSRFVSLYTVEPNYRASRFATTQVAAAGLNSGWISNHQIQMQETSVAPGQLAFFDFELTAPATGGSYTEKFRLAAEDYAWIEGGEFSLPITVKGGNSSDPTNPIIESPQQNQTGNLGPIMRVGLYDSEDPFSITADSPFEVRSGSGQLLASMPARTEVQVSYNRSTRQYSLIAAAVQQTLSDYLVIQALDDHTIMEILSLERRLPWNPAVNENTFRGSIEIRHSDATAKTWAINILPMEQYLKGIAETSSESPVEFLKVMSVAARTYATYHYERQTKHADEHFYVDSTYDQVYKGYALEKRHPRLVEAVDATTGQVVTYTDPATGETNIAITPYFSQSDGRTRDWSEVWGGEVAWAKSVPVPHDVGKPLLGHGVGMSARGGLLMVVEDGATYDEVLHYFFQGIQIEDRY